MNNYLSPLHKHHRGAQPLTDTELLDLGAAINTISNLLPRVPQMVSEVAALKAQLAAKDSEIAALDHALAVTDIKLENALRN